MTELPDEAERLLSVTPDAFVAERKRVAADLREAGRADEAAQVAGLRKPTAVVLAVNRAARDRPQAAKDAAEAAARVRKTQLSGEQDAYRAAVADLDRSLDLLAEVAVAHVGGKGEATGSMRQRVRDLLRSAVADEAAREALVRGALLAEQEASGFDSFAGAAVPTRPGSAKKKSGRGAQSASAARERRQREKTLKEELRRAERALREAVRSVAEAERERDEAEKAVTAARGALDRL